ncbi:glutathione synthetase ATP-binding domain-like protein [Hypoxylon trugodes]|uniref:glutathione synthetase ATP-binding domain-like protein n=1 Tax=Hypoxylon trugodes TaxID=326681 RepID=UPI00219ADB27|nr:glutathione synthetase ATP-binding domain-like protein [Hypoxylon trugodes]KAI1387027.1 glutathione synthetase ATP-binding domain-like protein [Hypoxylon trugodes]
MASVGYFSVNSFRGVRSPLRACVTRAINPGTQPWNSQIINYSRFYSKTPSLKSGRTRVAVLYQALDPPVIGGVKKPKKPGGYQDSGADIAFNLSKRADIDVISPMPVPNPSKDAGWCFPDTEEGILEAVDRGVTHLWANTILFASHPLQISKALDKHQETLQVVGQGPLVVEKYDDKQYVNDLLRRLGNFTMPKAWWIHNSQDVAAELNGVPYPIVAKPVRGRGSQGVKVCYSPEELIAHSRTLLANSSSIILEEFLQGEEITITVMPPTQQGSKYWSLPIVTRFNHEQGIAPYNGVVAVTANSRAISDTELDQTYLQAIEECQAAAEALGVTAPIRIDTRRLKESKDSKFALFDVNMKPNMTGPGRPGRDDQASLTLMAAAALGWDYQELLRRILSTSHSLKDLRTLTPR